MILCEKFDMISPDDFPFDIKYKKNTFFPIFLLIYVINFLVYISRLQLLQHFHDSAFQVS
jgi:hypothetical protein